VINLDSLNDSSLMYTTKVYLTQSISQLCQLSTTQSSNVVDKYTGTPHVYSPRFHTSSPATSPV